MCCCAKPNVNGEPGYSWDGKNIGTRQPDPPALSDGDVLLYDEPGRCGGMDSHCHHYRLVKSYGTYYLHVRNGSGDHCILVSFPTGDRSDLDLGAMDSNTRYWVLNAIYHAYSAGESRGSGETSIKYNTAFIEGRLKKRKSPGRDWHKVWIEPKVTRTEAA